MLTESTEVKKFLQNACDFAFKNDAENKNWCKMGMAREDMPWNVYRRLFLTPRWGFFDDEDFALEACINYNACPAELAPNYEAKDTVYDPEFEEIPIIRRMYESFRKQ